MPRVPKWRMQTFDGRRFQVIDWSEAFRSDLHWEDPSTIDEMRDFHVVFRLRAERDGILTFLDSDGSIVRRNGQVVHEDRDAHSIRSHEIRVSAGDRLDVAQWQHRDSWMWAAHVELLPYTRESNIALIEPYLNAVCRALRDPNGPPLKVYTNMARPLSCAVSIYSMIINGYRPSSVHIYGEHQWTDVHKRAAQTLFPFANVVPTEHVYKHLSDLDSRLVRLAQQESLAMKLCVSLFMPPYDFCYLDDDLFILEPIADALELYQDHDLVYAPDRDYEPYYRAIWSPTQATPFATGRVNGGLYLVHNSGRIQAQVEQVLKVPLNGYTNWHWEQGFYAYHFADAKTVALPTQRYFYPVHDGLPGGLLRYDWADNPCGFVTVHFGGPRRKPTDYDARALMHEVLGRRLVRNAEAVESPEAVMN